MKVFLLFYLLSSFDCMHISYPKVYHEEIVSFIEKTKNDFLLDYYKGNQLYIYFDEYNYSYESYLFYVEQDFQGAHPLTYIKTFNYYNDTYINLDDIFKYDDYYKFYLEAKKILIPELKKENMYIEDMFLNGIEPNKDNYKNIILCDDHLIIFFEHYQIAPYAAGIRSLKIKI